MEHWLQRLEPLLDKELVQIVMSSPRKKDEIGKIQIRPVILKNKLAFQASEYRGQKVYHRNMDKKEVLEYTEEKMQAMRQLEAQHQNGRLHILISKKGKVTVKASKEGCIRKNKELSHNRSKNYILNPDTPIPFLADLGVQTKEGKIIHARYDKFRQMNRFLEFVADVADKLPRDREAVIIDFGCGKSYLTFALYYYLHELKGYDIRIIGLDLKEDVIAHCNMLAEKYGYEKLSFLTGDIAEYDGVEQVDMVVTLHACDTATDFALDKAIRWNAGIILSVPCCQHELNGQIHNDLLEPILKYGLIKERMAALITDALRANVLEAAGYQVQILEFIDMEHTPKNILIRGVKSSKKKSGSDIRPVLDFLHLDPALVRLQQGKEKSDE